MDEKRRRSLHETVEKIREKPTKRRSLFETSDQSQNKINVDCYMKEWDQIWGTLDTHNTEYIINVNYPEDYVQKIKEEKDMWFTGIEDMFEKIAELDSQTECIQILEGCSFSPDRKASLQDFDSKINDFIENSKILVETREISQSLHKIRLEEINHQIKIFEKLCMLNNK